MQELWNIVDASVRFGAAIPLGVIPRRYWPTLETWIPVSRAGLASALATVALAAALAIPAFYRHAERNAGLAIDLTLQATGWRAVQPGATMPSDKIATATWGASFFSLFSFAFLTPIGLLCTYLGFTGTVRAVSTVADDARGDPILTMLDAVVRRAGRTAEARRARRSRERLEGPEVPDRLLPGRAAGFPDADYVIVSSRRKPDWEPGVFVVTREKWYKLGTPIDRQMAGGLRTLYPLTELRTQEVLRRGVPYELPPVK
jgi:hypothetical protein